MKLYISTKKMTFDDNTEHEIVLFVKNKEFWDYDVSVEVDDKFIEDTLKIFYKKDKKGNDTEEIDHKEFIIREQKTWHSFPLYEIVNEKIVGFDYSKYSYFANTDRRSKLASKISELYNPPSEAKITRKTLKIILDKLGMEYPDFFKKYNNKIEAIINKNPKN